MSVLKGRAMKKTLIVLSLGIMLFIISGCEETHTRTVIWNTGYPVPPPVVVYPSPPVVQYISPPVVVYPSSPIIVYRHPIPPPIIVYRHPIPPPIIYGYGPPLIVHRPPIIAHGGPIIIHRGPNFGHPAPFAHRGYGHRR
jgi:hypothetical protein